MKGSKMSHCSCLLVTRQETGQEQDTIGVGGLGKYCDKSYLDLDPLNPLFR